MISCVISDLGKVILFFDNHIFFRKLADYCPYSARDIAERVHLHRDMIRSFDTGKIEPADFYGEVVQKLEAEVGQDTFFRIYTDVFSLNPPVLDLLRRLKTGYKLILLSNTDVERFGFIKKKFPEIFLFDDYVLSYKVGYMKPHPQIYKEALGTAQVRAEECVFLDDLPENIEGAREVGMNVILYEPHTDLEAELKEMNVAIGGGARCG
jgi:epoxide hydrolase-like predicted phosphatase